MSILETVRARIQEIDARLSALNESAVERTFTAQEADEIEKLQAENQELQREVKLRESVVANKAAMAQPVRKTTLEVRPALHITSNEKAFKNLGEMANAVRAKARGQANDRVMNALSTFANEATDADGGVMVPGEFRTNIEKDLYGQNSLLSFCTKVPLTQNSIVIPVDDTMPWAPFSGTGNLSYKTEGVALDQVKPAQSSLTLTAHKLGVIVPASEELLQDNSAFSAYINQLVGEALIYKVNDAILKGTGSGQAKGFLSSSALKTVASGSGQVAGTVTAGNIKDMYFAMPQASRGNAVWVVNPNVESQLYGMVISGTTTPAFVPGGSMANSPFSTLLGRPVIVLPNAPALGAAGDVSFVDLSKYWAVTKAGLQADNSIHFWFDQVVQAFRFYIRLGGDTRRQSVITLPDASTQSYYVRLAAR